MIIHALADASAALGPAWEAKGGLAALHEFIGHLVAEVLAQRSTLTAEPGLVSGRDLMEHFNLGPSPLIGLIIKAIEEAGPLENFTPGRRPCCWPKRLWTIM